MALVQDLMTTGEVAKTFKVGPSTVRRWHDRGLLVGIETPSGQLRFPRDAVEAFLNPEPAESSHSAA